MRYCYSLLLLLLLPLALRAQQPFESLGVRVPTLSLTNGRYPEFFDNDSLRRIGLVVYNTRLQRIAYLLPADSLTGCAPAEVSSRWMVVDPLAMKDNFISPYAFCRDNAIRYMDPDGRQVIVRDKKQREEIANRINEHAAGTFAFNSKGRLYLKERHVGEKGSDYYTSRLQAAIKDKDKIFVNIAQKVNVNGKTKDVDKDMGGGVTKASTITTTETDPKTGKEVKSTEHLSEITISGNANTNLKDTNGQPLRDTPADILAHEFVSHAIPHSVGRDSGNAVENENKVRIQQPDGQNQQR
jgi:hypothetical protein